MVSVGGVEGDDDSEGKRSFYWTNRVVSVVGVGGHRSPIVWPGKTRFPDFHASSASSMCAHTYIHARVLYVRVRVYLRAQADWLRGLTLFSRDNYRPRSAEILLDIQLRLGR